MLQITEILENKRNIEHLSEAKARGKLSHAYIINGPAGSGKRTFVDYMAAALLCDKTHEEEDDGQASLFSFLPVEKAPLRTLKEGPCGECSACARSLSGNHPDIIYLKREKERTIAVKEVRTQIIDDICVKPYYGPYKIYIVEEAQFLNENSQNALLKTIEEPPEYGIIFLLSENADAFLDTIKSRCIRLDMEKLPKETISEIIKEKFNLSRIEADKIAAFAAGNLGRALELAGDGGESEFIDNLTALLKKVAGMNAVDIFEQAAELGKDSAYETLEIARMWYRDVLILKSGNDEQRKEMELFFPAERSALENMADKISFEGLNNILLAIDTAADRLNASVKAEAALENLFLAIRRNSKSKGRNNR